ncbi:hypothetical protein KZO25_10525 [Halomonas sp. ANAO-440]|uniref:hypothetical protein n=1 Tax=Halomonas sp. ANAO-440 TaxID=2861360 RepID=UPI001CAA45A1|nr:hypothetical protein [Halomonas sp. ANAO-440]MBZ0330747.1 hypothetical protein [Halomonas sp. ANAO-440]
MTDIVLWQKETSEILPATAKTPLEISSYAAQLSNKDRKQIVSAFESNHFEMAVSYLWGKTITALKKELSTVGITLIGEMLDRPNLDEDDDVEDILTAKDAIKLAEELGIVTQTDALRLRHTHEIITHFSQLDIDESDSEEIDETEALSSLKICVKAVLGRPKVEVAKKFVEFREALEGETLTQEDQRVEMLKSSPYFFLKLTVSVLMSAAKKNVGANLEHVLANINVLLPVVWPQLRESEKWQVGHTYAETYADGKTSTVSGLKSALSKVRGFDYVPENLRSDTFVKAATSVLRAHDGMNNFYNEAAPVKELGKLGSTIPTPALPACITALLSVVLGNTYGVAWSAEPEASRILSKVTDERWSYYINNVLPSDTRILEKILLEKPRSNWIKVVDKYGIGDLTIKNKSVGLLISATQNKKDARLVSSAKKLLSEYYGKNT